MFLQSKTSSILLIICASLQVVYSKTPGPCSTIDEKIIESQYFANGNYAYLSKNNGNSRWQTLESEMVLDKWGPNNILISAGDASYTHNFAKIDTSSFGESQWVWLDKAGSCTLGIKLGDVKGGYMYKQATYSGN